MSNIGSAIYERSWGHKATANSAFRDHAKAIDYLLARIDEGDFAPFARMSAAALKLALLDAEVEVVADPDAYGPDQQALVSTPSDGIDMIAVHCAAIGLDPVAFRESSSSRLDLIADTVRAERAAAPSAEIICIAEARQRREAALAAEATFLIVPVRSRRRIVGHQLAWAM